MADKGQAKGKGAGGASAAASADAMPFPIELPSAMFSGPGLLTLADMLPVMAAFVDKDLSYRFMNKPLAEWLERPRREHARPPHARGARRGGVRRARGVAGRGARRASACSSPPTSTHPTRGTLAAQSDYMPWVRPATGAVDGLVIVRHRT